MSKFGWSYPAGAAEDPSAPYNQDASLLEDERDVLIWLSAETRTQAERHLYKATTCGAWIRWHSDGIELGSIVEGSDAEVTTDPLRYPFSKAELQETIDYIESETEMLWQEAND